MVAERLKRYAVIMSVVFVLVMIYLTGVHSFIDTFIF